MKHRAGAYTGARFAHVASHKKKQKKNTILCQKAVPADHKSHRKSVGTAKSVRLGPKSQRKTTGVSLRRKPPPERAWVYHYAPQVPCPGIYILECSGRASRSLNSNIYPPPCLEGTKGVVIVLYLLSFPGPLALRRPRGGQGCPK